MLPLRSVHMSYSLPDYLLSAIPNQETHRSRGEISMPSSKICFCFYMISIVAMLGRTSSFRYPRCRMMMSSKASLRPPDEPINFSNKFFIPEFTGKLLLEELNPHPLDSKITFESSAHKYYYDGVLIERSVTEVVGSFFEKFDADLVARRMIAGNNWPRPEYTQRNGVPYTVSMQ